MIITEQEAKSKWCPFTFSISESRDQFSGQGIREGGPWCCCTSNCMAWRAAESNTGYCALLTAGQGGEK
jgi:hypothetical protein